MKLTIEDIQIAEKQIQNHAQRTQCLFSRSASDLLGCEVYLKHENEQKTGSFKIRGAMNRLSTLDPSVLKQGVVACSAGNHAQGVAYCATTLGAKAHIVMPKSTPIVKISATQGYGAEVILHGDIFDESYQKAKELEAEKGYYFVHPFFDEKVIAGQGTLGLEMFEQVKDLDSVVVPIGGGGLISGISVALKALNPKIRIFGVVPENVPGMYKMYKREKLKNRDRKPTLADGLAVKSPNEELLETFIRPNIEDIVTVSEGDIASAIVFLMERAKTVTEGSGAIGLAAALKMKGQWDLGQKTCILLCGGNIDLNVVSKIIERGLSQTGRLARIQIIAKDQPGSLKWVSGILADERANIIEVTHNRLGLGLELNQTKIEVLMECRGQEHVDAVVTRLRKKCEVRSLN